MHKEGVLSARAHTVPWETHHDAQLEGKSADRLDAGRPVDDIIGGVPLAPPGLPAQPVLQPIGVHLREPQVYSTAQGGYVTTDGGYYTGGGYTGGTAGYPSGYGQPGYGYDFGRPGYNPGGLGGPASGIGVRPGLGAGGFGPGR